MTYFAIVSRATGQPVNLNDAQKGALRTGNCTPTGARHRSLQEINTAIVRCAKEQGLINPNQTRTLQEAAQRTHSPLYIQIDYTTHSIRITTPELEENNMVNIQNIEANPRLAALCMEAQALAEDVLKIDTAGPAPISMPLPPRRPPGPQLPPRSQLPHGPQTPPPPQPSRLSTHQPLSSPTPPPSPTSATDIPPVPPGDQGQRIAALEREVADAKKREKRALTRCRQVLSQCRQLLAQHPQPRPSTLDTLKGLQQAIAVQ